MKSPLQWFRQAFTLIELLAVIVIIMIVTGLIIGLSTYSQRVSEISATKAEMATIATALEAYKSDWGYYPPTATGRVSACGFWEATNNWILYRALSGDSGRPKYLNLSPKLVSLNTMFASGWHVISGTTNMPDPLTNIFDHFAMPLTYYCSPATPYALVSNAGVTNSGYMVGGQINVTTFDLFSYGPNRHSYVHGATVGLWFRDGAYWTNSASAKDDITNWGR